MDKHEGLTVFAGEFRRTVSMHRKICQRFIHCFVEVCPKHDIMANMNFRLINNFGVRTSAFDHMEA